MNVLLSSIEWDTTIQCRESIDMGVVNDYAERMADGAEFPPVELFGSGAKCWIGDGWHRVMAAKQNGADSIEANLHAGTRVDALKLALGANAVHGHRRTNADKRRCVEIALREFPKLSSRAVAAMCGVHHDTVESARPQLAESATCERTGQDGKQYPATREPRCSAPEPREQEPSAPVEQQPPAAQPPERRVLGAPSNGLQFARMALMDLEQIRPDDVERVKAFSLVREWLDAREA